MSGPTFVGSCWLITGRRIGIVLARVSNHYRSTVGGWRRYALHFAVRLSVRPSVRRGLFRGVHNCETDSRKKFMVCRIIPYRV